MTYMCFANGRWPHSFVSGRQPQSFARQSKIIENNNIYSSVKYFFHSGEDELSSLENYIEGILVRQMFMVVAASIRYW